jgi:hypothetical protein
MADLWNSVTAGTLELGYPDRDGQTEVNSISA